MIKNKILQIILGFFLADFLSGLFHWIEDTYLDYCIDIPIIKDISKGNEMHHYFPRAILKNSYYQNIRVTTILTIFVFIIIYLSKKEILFNYKYFFITLFIFSSISPLIHRLCHMRECEKNKYILYLQKFGILNSDEHHKIHHIKSDVNYCLNTSYINIILDNIYFWRIIEFIIYTIFGLKATRKEKYNDYKSIHTKYHIESTKKCPNVINEDDYNILKVNLDQYKKCV
jgi:hypothetical protein